MGDASGIFRFRFRIILVRRTTPYSPFRIDTKRHLTPVRITKKTPRGYIRKSCYSRTPIVYRKLFQNSDQFWCQLGYFWHLETGDVGCLGFGELGTSNKSPNAQLPEPPNPQVPNSPSTQLPKSPSPQYPNPPSTQSRILDGSGGCQGEGSKKRGLHSAFPHAPSTTTPDLALLIWDVGCGLWIWIVGCRQRGYGTWDVDK